MVNFGTDVLIILATCMVGLTGAWLAYRLGQPVWEREFHISGIDPMPKLGLSSGEIGEVANLLLIASVCLFLLIVTPDANLTDLWLGYWPYYLTGVVVCGVGVFVYTRFAVARTKREGFTQKQRVQKNVRNITLLARGYFPYVAYGTAVFTIIIGYIGALTIDQFILDHQKFRVAKSAIDFLCAENGQLVQPNAELLLARFEIIFGNFEIAEGYIRDQVNSLIMVLLGITLAYAAVYQTGLRHVYAKRALDILKYTVFTLVAICIVVGGFVFLTTHLSFVDGVLDHLRQHQPVMRQASWEIVHRYHELLAELSRQRGVFGFLLGLTTDRGGLVLVIPLLQLLIGRAKGKDTRNA